MLSSVLLVAIAGQAPAVTLTRTFLPGERLAYRVQSNLQVQSRASILQTWMPEDVAVKYDFSLAVEKLKTDGIAQLRYKRPTLLMISDAGDEGGPERKLEKLGWDLQLTLSPYNKTIELKDLTKKPARWMGRTAALQGDPFGEFISEVHRLALFAGGLDSSLDLAPPLPLREVSVGDTWKSTVSYQPQKLSGGNKTAVQRLDYTYTYKGIVAVGAMKVHRVVGSVDLNTDLASFFHDLAEVSSEDTGLSKFPLTLKTNVEFDLDLKTLRTLAARASSQGGFQIFTTENPGAALAEERFRGQTTMTLLSIAAPMAPAKKKG